MKNKLRTKLLCFFLCVCMLIPMLTACENNNDNPSDETDTYYTSMYVNYNPNGEYKGVLELGDDVDDSFTDLITENFTLNVYNHMGETRASAELNNYSITKTDDKKLEFTFWSPFEYNENISYVLMSETAVTAKKYKIAAMVYVYAPEPELSIDYKGSYYGTDAVVITATLTDDWKFAQDLTSDMLVFPEGFDVTVEVVRESDSKAVFTVTNIPENFTGVVLSATLSANAIDSEFATETYLSLDYFRPNIEIDASSVCFDEKTSTFTVGKAILPEGVSGVNNGISITNNLCSVTEQSYDETNRTYSFKLAFPSDAAAKNLMPYISVDAILKKETEEFKYAFKPYVAIAGIKGDVVTDMDNEKLYVEITPYNATFAEDFTANDVTITGAESLSGFTVSSLTPDKLVYAADYTEAMTKGVAISFDISGAALNTSFGSDAYSFMLYISPYSDGKDMSGSEFLDKITTSALGGFGGALGSSAAEFILPYVYEFWGIDTSDPELNAIKDSLTNLTYAIDDLSNDVSNIAGFIEVGTNKNILNDFQSLESSLLSSELTILSDEDVITYIARLCDINNHILTYEKYCDYIYKSLKFALMQYEGFDDVINIEGLYNMYDMCVVKANELSLTDFIKWISNDELFSFVEVYFLATWDFSYLFDKIDIKDIYEMLRGVRMVEMSPEIVSCFTKKVDKINVNNSYIKDVISFGDKIIRNSSGASDGIIDLYFQVIDNAYNFESQTISAKKAFVSKLQSIYLANTAIALQYCEAIGDGNASLLRSNLSKVMNKIDAAFKQIEEMEALAAKGNDKLLVSGQIVSKKMNKVNVKDLKYSNMTTGNISINDIEENFTGFVSVSEDTYKNMMDRAKKRGLTLAKDLAAAGFTELAANNEEKYCYMTNDAYKKYVEISRADRLGYSYLMFLAIAHEEKLYEFKATFVAQDSVTSYSVNRNTALLTIYMHMESAYTVNNPQKTYLFSTNQYNCVIGFSKANKQ